MVKVYPNKFLTRKPKKLFLAIRTQSKPRREKITRFSMVHIFELYVFKYQDMLNLRHSQKTTIYTREDEVRTQSQKNMSILSFFGSLSSKSYYFPLGARLS